MITAAALTQHELGDLFWLIGWSVLIVCIAAVFITIIIVAGRNSRG